MAAAEDLCVRIRDTHDRISDRCAEMSDRGSISDHSSSVRSLSSSGYFIFSLIFSLFGELGINFREEI
jgi:hypothetical protein